MYSQLQQNTGVSEYFFCGFLLLENIAFRIQFSVLKIPILVFKTPTSAQCQFNTRRSFQIFCSRHVHIQSALQFRGKKTNLLFSVFLSTKSEVFLGVCCDGVMMKNANIVAQSTFMHVVNFIQNKRDRKFRFRDFTEAPLCVICKVEEVFWSKCRGAKKHQIHTVQTKFLLKSLDLWICNF